MPDEVNKGSKMPSISTLVLKVMIVIAFSLASYYAWDATFNASDGVCVGPICIHQGDEAIE